MCLKVHLLLSHVLILPKQELLIIIYKRAYKILLFCFYVIAL